MLKRLSICSRVSRRVSRVSISLAGFAAATLWATSAAAVTTITVDFPGCTNGGTLTYDSASRMFYCAGASSQPSNILTVATPDCAAGTALAWSAAQGTASCQAKAGATPGATLRLGVGLPDCIAGMVTWNATTKTLTCRRVTQWLNVDASTSSVYDSLTDGLIIMRYLFGIRGAPLVANALAPTATRTDPVAIAQYLDSIRASLDIDGNGSVDALTDGTLILRYLFGTRGTSLTNGAVAANATNPTAAGIEAKMLTLVP